MNNSQAAPRLQNFRFSPPSFAWNRTAHRIKKSRMIAGGGKKQSVGRQFYLWLAGLQHGGSSRENYARKKLTQKNFLSYVAIALKSPCIKKGLYGPFLFKSSGYYALSTSLILNLTLPCRSISSTLTLTTSPSFKRSLTLSTCSSEICEI